MKIFFDTVGCRLNQSEIESMAGHFREAGYEVVASAAEADMMVINTCTVTAGADADSRKKIRKAARAGVKRIIATGCYATMRPEEIARLPGVDQVVLNRRKAALVEEVLGLDGIHTGKTPARRSLPGQRKRTRAFIKAQDGCDNHCTFCITRIARGRGVSQPLGEIFADVEAALAGGVKEIVLTGVNLGSWGRDLRRGNSLADLIKELVIKFSPPRLRLSSLESWDVGDDLLEAMVLPGVCRHLHLPLQSGSDTILKKMGRKTDTRTYAETVEKIRGKIPEIAITTDVIVAFPWESEKYFNESLAFIRSMAFAGGHVFRYSPRPGTPAADMPSLLDGKTAKVRNQRVRELFSELAIDYMRGFIKKELMVLWEKTNAQALGWQLSGFSDNYIRVVADSDRNAYNEISRVIIRRMDKQSLSGEMTEF